MSYLLRSVLVHISYAHTLSACDNREHNKKKEEIMKSHEAQLEELSSSATESAVQIHAEIDKVQNQVREKEIYLAKAQELLSTRYKVAK